jgi:hypothetical protein
MKPNIKQRSWLSLVTFCAMTVLITAVASALLFAGVSVAFAVVRPGQGADANANANTGMTAAPSAEPSVIASVIAQSEVESQSGIEQPSVAQPAVQPVAAQTIDDSSATADQTFAGLITDSRCGARHRMNSDKTPAECARSCVRNRGHYILVNGEKIYALEGDPAQTGEACRRARKRRRNARGQHDQGQNTLTRCGQPDKSRLLDSDRTRKLSLARAGIAAVILPAAPPLLAATFWDLYLAPWVRMIPGTPSARH